MVLFFFTQNPEPSVWLQSAQSMKYPPPMLFFGHGGSGPGGPGGLGGSGPVYSSQAQALTNEPSVKSRASFHALAAAVLVKSAVWLVSNSHAGSIREKPQRPFPCPASIRIEPSAYSTPEG